MSYYRYNGTGKDSLTLWMDRNDNMAAPVRDNRVWKIRFYRRLKDGTLYSQTVYKGTWVAAHRFAQLRAQEGTLLYFGQYKQEVDMTEKVREDARQPE